MDRLHRIGAVLVVLSISALGCTQSTAGQTGGADVATATLTRSAEPTVAASIKAAVPQPPVEFTGRIMCGPPVSPDRKGTEETLEVGSEGLVLTRQRGAAFRQTVAMTDPRLDGTAYHTFEADYYAMPGAESGPQVAAWTYRIENEGGAWEARGYGGSFSDGTPIRANSTGVWIGEGGYAGLIAIMESTNIEGACGDKVRGVIFDSAPAPQPYNPG